MTSSQPTAHLQPLTLKAVLLVLLTVVLWGGNPVATSFSIDCVPPVLAAGLRFLLASLFMYAWCKAEGKSLTLHRRELVPTFFVGLFLFLQIGSFNLGIARSSSSHASLLINTYVMWVIGFDHFLTRHHRLTWRSTFGAALAGCGALILLGGATSSTDQQDVPTLLGDSILLVSGLLLATKVIYTKHVVRTVEPGKLIFWHDVIGTAMFFACSAFIEPWDFAKITPVAWIGLLYQGVLVGGLCFGVHARLLQRHAATQISVFSFATPIVGVLTGVMMRGDLLSPSLILAGVTVATGIVLVNWPERDTPV